MFISEEYKAQLAQLHDEKADFGTSSPMYKDLIHGIIKRFKPADLLDYGAGKQALKAALGIVEGYHAYDPCIEAISAKPEPRDLVVCTDVLEHVEPHHLVSVLADLERVTAKVGFFAIHTGAALNFLPDGRNAHIIQEPARWWLQHLIRRWHVEAFERGQYGCWAIVTPLKD